MPRHIVRKSVGSESGLRVLSEAVIGDIEVRDAGEKGCGVFAKRGFSKNEFIFRRRHARIARLDELEVLSEWERLHLCELDFDRFAVLEAPGCYLNHSCDPNAMRHGVKVFAWRAIGAGQEITIDYRLNAFDGEGWQCACGSANCTGTVVGSFFAMDHARQLLLLPHAPEFIRREYRRRVRPASAVAGSRARNTRLKAPGNAT